MIGLAETSIAASPRLTTARYLLRLPEPGDAPAIHRLVNDWGVVRMLTRLPFPYPRSLTDDWIASTAEQALDGSAYHFAIIETRDGIETLLGCVGLRIDAESRSGDLGYWIGRPFWGGGVAREAAARVARWALAHLDIGRLTAQVALDNPASAAVLRRIGFRESGTATQMFLARGGEHPVTQFELRHDGLAPAEAPAGPAIATAAPGATAATGTPVVLVAACALIDGQNRVLLARRPEGKRMAGLWEFPGGKLEPGERPEAALIRELREELGIDVEGACLTPFAFASHAYNNFHLLMPLFLCRRWQGTPQGREGQTLAWVAAEALSGYAMPEADKPLVPLLRDLL